MNLGKEYDTANATLNEIVSMGKSIEKKKKDISAFMRGISIDNYNLSVKCGNYEIQNRSLNDKVSSLEHLLQLSKVEEEKAKDAVKRSEHRQHLAMELLTKAVGALKYGQDLIIDSNNSLLKLYEVHLTESKDDFYKRMSVFKNLEDTKERYTIEPSAYVFQDFEIRKRNYQNNLEDLHKEINEFRESQD